MHFTLMPKEFLQNRSVPVSIWCLIVVCCSIEFLLSAGDYGLLGADRVRRSVYENAGFWPGLLGDWVANYPIQPYLMFLTYGFLHSGLVHLTINMITLWSLGREIVTRVGQTKFLGLYSGSILSGGLGYALLADQVRPMVGASGALFGLAGALLAWNYIDRFALKAGLWPVARSASFLLALNLVLYWAMDGLLAWETHLGGFLGGWVIAMLVDPRSRDTGDLDEAP